MEEHILGLPAPLHSGLREQDRTFAMPVQDIQGRDEELMGILLLVPCQMPGMSPYQVQQLVRDVGRPMPGVKLLRERRETKSLVGNKCYTLNIKHRK